MILGSLQEGARIAVEVCMSIRSGEHVFVLTDRPTLEIGKAIHDAAEEVTKQILELIPWANVTYYAAESKPGELGIRGPFIRTAVKYARHGHMPSVTKELMETGMCADYYKISDLTKKVERIVKTCRKARIVTKAGTELEVDFNPSWRWKVCDGLSPVKCANEQLRQEFVEYLNTDANSNRLGEFAIGTNIFLDRLTGNLLQDEKIPSVHCAFGDPYPDETGADWQSKTHIDGIMLKCSIWIDGKQIMDEGRHLTT